MHKSNQTSHLTSVTLNNSTEMEIDEQNTLASVSSQIESAPAT
ncbi:15721_t:CDS:1, partial [Acaulospora morrowiae]